MKTNDTATVWGTSREMFAAFVGLVRERPGAMISMWGGLFAVLLSFSFMLGIVPTLETDEAAADEPAVVDVLSTPLVGDGTPVRIIADAIALDATIVAPASRDIAVLDEALLSGVVHYPGSADLGEDGNVFLFGHSTGFRVVQNDAFKVFNDLKNLKERDLIRVQSDSREYVYRVVSVSLVNAEEALVDLSRTGRRLTLSTCNSFGAKQERYVVEAELVGDFALEGAPRVGY